MSINTTFKFIDLRNFFSKLQYERGYNQVSRFAAILYDIEGLSSITEPDEQSPFSVILKYTESLNKARAAAKNAMRDAEEKFGEDNIIPGTGLTCDGIIAEMERVAEIAVYNFFKNGKSEQLSFDISGGIFIIPNTAAYHSDFFQYTDGEKVGQYIDPDAANSRMNLCVLNNVTLYGKTEFAQTWSYDMNDDTSNYQRHYIKGLPRYKIFPLYVRCNEYVPIEILERFKEGEQVTYKEEINFYLQNPEDKKNHDDYIIIPLLINWSLTANQTVTRYRHCGNFEDAVNRVRKVK